MTTALPPGLLALFAVACGASVANVYYAQPLLDALARDFGIGLPAVGIVVTATQVGCAVALVFVVPLGDLVDRRRLMAVQAMGLAAALGAVAGAASTPVLLAGMAAVGLVGTAMTQGLIAHAAAAAPPGTQGRVVGAAQGGVFTGLLLARVVAGAVSDLAGWRGVYAGAAAAMLVLAAVLWRHLPPTAPATPGLGYGRLLASMVTLLRQDRVLQQRGLLALLMFAAFNVFWSALVLPLSAPPHGFSHTAIGAFGLVGAVGALVATRAGRWADRGHAQRTTGVALLLLTAAWWPLSRLDTSLAALVVGILLLDVGGQALHVTNQSLIFRQGGEAHSRRVGLYMLFYSAGSGLGAIASTAVYAQSGWTGVCVLGASISAVALALCAVTWLGSVRAGGSLPGSG